MKTLLTHLATPDDLRALPAELLAGRAREIREFLIDKVRARGGHLGSNLGIVEITIALHRVFDSPGDAIVFDTGHQAYVHKIRTGRRDAFDRLRLRGGLGGYPSREESVHDHLDSSHASTALAHADGMAKARGIAGGDARAVVAVIGDGALTGGVAWETLNNLGAARHRPVIVVLDDNGRCRAAPTISAGCAPPRASPSSTTSACVTSARSTGTGRPLAVPRGTWTHAFARHLCALGERRHDLLAVTAAMPVPTGPATTACGTSRRCPSCPACGWPPRATRSACPSCWRRPWSTTAPRRCASPRPWPGRRSRPRATSARWTCSPPPARTCWSWPIAASGTGALVRQVCAPGSARAQPGPAVRVHPPGQPLGAARRGRLTGQGIAYAIRKELNRWPL